MRYLFFILVLHLGFKVPTTAQKNEFWLGDDLSYTNEMEDCGVQFKENNLVTDLFKLFARQQHNMVRLRLWHTPSWYDTLNTGKRYSDLPDVKKSIRRAREQNMAILLDFHLSDIWADPQRQLAPAAWQPIVNQLPVLKDSLFNYIQSTLLHLNAENLLPEMVQIGNETNRGILLSYDMDARGWSMDWRRNAELFNTGIRAVRAVEQKTGKKIRIALHFANPAETEYFMAFCWNNEVRDFDVIGMSYYWAWHKPVTIAQCGDVIENLRKLYPGKEVMIFETGYTWTQESNDQAPNIISEFHEDYAPPSPAMQQKWLIDLSHEVKKRGGIGVLYWEPAWQSSPCRTPWGQGSHQEHATYFDFKNNALPAGGLYWPAVFLKR
jgi:arabinogalactan endo-1,4-beta-galactosidase